MCCVCGCENEACNLRPLGGMCAKHRDKQMKVWEALKALMAANEKCDIGRYSYISKEVYEYRDNARKAYEEAQAL